jgi:hypothetical protein
MPAMIENSFRMFRKGESRKGSERPSVSIDTTKAKKIIHNSLKVTQASSSAHLIMTVFKPIHLHALGASE